ncbi:hypothetical protein BDZ94DRAFT_1258923 [Collybia nuda]|uniref:BCAS3 WD40 domain-containing protein n=1 Tax=Collybia nuda TaxID=64659 RepID=A0A9P5Y992_9AGAR|nr:hypothetical protein BDZ94DRAFT_1258923 [Collybia nuda]
MPSRRNARSSKSSRHQSTVATPINPQTPALETPAELPLLDFRALEGHMDAEPTSGPSPALSSGSLPSSPLFFEPPLIPTGSGQRSPPALSFEEFSNFGVGGRYDALGPGSTLWDSYAAPQDLIEPSIPEPSSPAHGPSNGMLDSMFDAYGTPGDVVSPALPAEVDILPPSAEMEEPTFEPASPPRILVPPSPSLSPAQISVSLPVPESPPPVSPVPLPVPLPRRFASGYGDAGNGGAKDAAPSGHAYSNLVDGSHAGSGLAQAMKRSSASSGARARKNGARKASSLVGEPITKASPSPVAELSPEPVEAASPAVLSRRRDPSTSLSPAVVHNVTTPLPTEPVNPLTTLASEVAEGSPRSVKTTAHTAIPISPLATSSKSSNPSNTSVSPVKTISPRNKRFSAPLPFTQLSAGAPAVVDLGVAGAGGGGGYGGGYTDGASYGTRGVSERAGPRTRSGDREGDGEILWAHWDHVSMSPGPGEEGERRLLFVGYAYALQVWDCSTLDAVDEVLSIRVGGEAVASQGVAPDEWEGAGRVVHASVLRGPGGGAMVGVLTEGTGSGQGAGGILFVYSLQLCRVVRRIELDELGKGSKKAWEGVPVAFEANEKFIIISAASPPSLTVLSTETFAFLTHIRSEALVAYAPPITGYPGSQGPTSGFATSASAAASAVLPTTAMGAATTAYGAATTATAMLSNAFAGSYNNRFNPTHTNPGRNLYNNNYIYDNADTHFNTYHQRNNNNNPVALHSALLLDSHAGGGQEQRQHRQPQYQHLHQQSSQDQGQLHHHQTPQYQEYPRPVFSLSNRLLAYASPVPPGSRTSSPTSTVPAVGVAAGTSVGPGNRPSGGGPSVVGGLGLPTTQAELGNAALRVGGSVLSGMRTLGGLAVSAARSRVSGADPNPGGGVGGLTNRFFSRSAPADVDAGVREEEERRKRERRYSGTNSSVSGSPGDGDVGGSGSGVGKYLQRLGPSGSLEGGCYVTVVDLATLGMNVGGEPTKVAEFVVSKDRPIAGLTFSPDGCSIMVAPRDGQVLQVYQVRPVPVVGCGIGSAGDGEGRSKRTSISGAAPGSVRREARTPWHVYDLRRGRTSAVVEDTDWAEDGRWIAIGTRKRTVHVFAVNPYGGKPDHRSHLDGRVRNVLELQPVPTDLGPIIRLRVAKALGPEQPRAPLAFTFIKSNESTLPSNLLPSVTAAPSISTASADSGTSPPTSPRPLRRRPTNFQDILLFDPTDGTLSLRRCTVELRPKEPGLASAALTATSISLPGMGGAGRLSGSPSSSAGGYGHVRSSSRSRSGLTQMMEVPMELTGRDNIVATWALQRRRDSREIRNPLEGRGGDTDYGPERSERGDWLAQAELSTCSRSPKILPRPIYLSHQFSFHTLGEDYHALIRRYQFDIGGQKMEVRKEVQVSAYPAGSGESFVEGFSAPRDMRNRTLSSSFDEPLASALAGDLNYPHTSNVLPMLPNGTPRSKPQSFRNSIPIRTMTDGMSESLGRFRREIIKARSPRLRPRPDSSMSASVPLEFDEEDEDFLSNDTLDVPALDRDADSGSRGTSRGGADSGASISTPATSTRPLDDDVEDAWNGWTSEDKLAVEEAERFDNISVVGFLDEEQTAAAVVPIAAPKKKGRGRRR